MLCVLSDSGTLSEESAILGFPAVLIRTSTERPEAIEKGMVVIGGVKSNDVLLSMDIATTINKENKGDKELTSSIGCNIPEDYKETNISDKVVRIISSYYKIINKVVWDKD